MKQILLFFAFFLPVCAFSQFYEPFEGPEVPPAWTGGREFFRIPSAGTLQFDGGRKSGTYSLGVPVAYTPTMEWEGKVSFGFNPSTANHARMYVYATGQPSDILLYVQIGHNEDNVSLYRWEGNADPVRVIAGRKGILDAAAPSVEVRLAMENTTVWTLYTRLPGEKAFYKEGTYRTAPLPDVRAGGNLLLACCCKAASKKEALFNFGPIRISSVLSPDTSDPDDTDPDDPDPDKPDPDKSDPDIVDPDHPDSDHSGSQKPGGDTSLPTLQSVAPLTLSTLQFCFSGPVLIQQAQFTVSGIGTAQRQTYADETRQVVNTRFGAEMETGCSYTIAWEGLTDAEGTPLASDSCHVFLEEGDEPGGSPDEPGPSGNEGSYPEKTLRINEVMADPKGLTLLRETEYVELKNTSSSPVPLKNWVFVYGGKAVVLEEAELPAGGYLVLYKAGRALSVDAGGLEMPLDKFPALLANAGKELQLKDPAGNVIDTVTYAKAKPGVSWERNETGWHLSTDPRGGTPGSANSPAASVPEEPEEPDAPNVDPQPPLPESQTVWPGEIVFNELLPNPFEGGSEYIELYNRSERSLSLAGLAIATRKNDGNLSTRYPLSSVPFKVPSGGYVLLTKNQEGVSSFYLISSPDVLHELRLPVLANTASTLVLLQAADAKVIDEVSYAKGWHAAWVKNEKGIALERIDPDRPTQEASNWTSASETAGYGTPGYRNSQFGAEQAETPTGIEAPVYSETTGEYGINYYLDQPGYSCRAWVFDTAGRRLAEVANQTLSGREGCFTWSGRASDGSRLTPGVYLFYADLYHTSGKVKAYKRVFLVH